LGEQLRERKAVSRGQRISGVETQLGCDEINFRQDVPSKAVRRPECVGLRKFGSSSAGGELPFEEGGWLEKFKAHA
jgi:hypothetical protein